MQHYENSIDMKLLEHKCKWTLTCNDVYYAFVIFCNFSGDVK